MTEMTKEWAIEKVEGYGLSSDYADVIYLATILLKHERRGAEIERLETKNAVLQKDVIWARNEIIRLREGGHQ